MGFKIYRQEWGHNQTVHDTLQKTFVLFFNVKRGTYTWFYIKAAAEGRIPSRFQEVEFESWEHVHELIWYHPDVKRRGGFIGDRATLRIGKTDRWTSWGLTGE